MAKSGIGICVTCVGGRLIFDILRGLRRCDDGPVRILGVDSDGEAHGRLLCDAFATVPRADANPDAYLERLEALHREHGFDVLLLLSEGEARVAAQHRERLLALGIRPSVSGADTVLTMTDKLKMLERAAAAGIDVGRFRAVDGERAARIAAAELGYPDHRVVLKPRRGAGSRGVMILDAVEPVWRALLPNRFCGTGGLDAVVAAMRREGASFEDLIAVPYVDGPVYDVDCIAQGGRLIDVAARLRQLRNPLWPTSTGHKIETHPAVAEMARALCAAFAVDGAADFDIALDAGGKPVLFDAAARFSGSVGGSLAAGANFPGRLVRRLLNLPCEPLRIREGTVVRPYITMAEIPPANERDYL